MTRCLRNVQEKYALHRLIRLRQRYIFTKSNKVRLRYVAGTLTMCLFAGLGTFNVSANALALKWVVVDDPAHFAVAQGGPDPAYSREAESQASEGIRKAAIVIRKPPGPLYRTISIGDGDTVAGVLQTAGISGSEAYQAVEALSEHYDPRKIRPGQEIRVDFKRGAENEAHFTKMSLNIDPLKTVQIIRAGEDGFIADISEKPIERRTYAYNSEIETSLYGSALRDGIPSQIVAELIRIYSWNVDFQRDIRQGDRIEVMYEADQTADGHFARYGDVLYASLSVGGKEIPMYRYAMADGRVDYFGPDGQSVRKVLMKTPIDGARLSSGFGMRKHPILGYNKMHKGADFAAPSGTPIYAAGDGTVDFAGRQGGYGNYIRLRHNGTLKTAYAHMSRFAKGMSTGKRVKQGDVIGYVGTTGRSTGPHLHYEVLVDGSQVNPNSINLPTGEQLEGDEMRKFKTLIGGIRQQYVSLTENVKLAKSEY